MPSSTTIHLAGHELSFTCHSALLAGEGAPNSLHAIRECVEAQVSRIEIDVHSMADGEYLVCHANRLEEVTTSSGPVGRLTRDEALKLRSKGRGQPRPLLLSEAVELAEGFRGELQLDLKDWRPLTPERAHALGDLVRPLGERAFVSSGRDWNLRAIAREAPGLRLGFDPNHYIDYGRRGGAALPARRGAYGYRDDHPLALGQSQPVEAYLEGRFEMLLAQCPSACELFIDYHLLLQAEAEGALLPPFLHGRGVAVTAWTLDYDGEESLAKVRRLVAIGVDRITTNTSRQFIAELSSER